MSNDATANASEGGLPGPKANACGAGLTGYKGYVKVQSGYPTSNLQNLAVVIDTVSTGHDPCNASAYGGGYFWNYGSINAGRSATRAWIFAFTSAASFTFSGHVEGTVEALPILAAHLGASSFAIDGNRKLYAWGSNSSGQLGLGVSADRSAPAQVGSDTNWASVSPGMESTMAIRNDGLLWAWGDNSYGQLGLGDGANRNVPTRVGLVTDTDWASVSGGGYHTLAIKKDGSLWAWGLNLFGQLGLGDSGDGTDRNVPTRVGTRNDWAAVAAGYRHSMAVTTDGELWAWGMNAYGQLGLGDSGAGTDRNVPTRVGSAKTWASVAAGLDHTLALRRDGSLWGWGQDGFHQAGYAPTELCSGVSCSSVPIQVGSSTDWTAVAAGGYHSLALRSDKTLWGWGYDENAEVGMPPVGTCPYGPCVAAPTQIGSATSWVSTAAGATHSLASQGTEFTLYSWGENANGQCGQGYESPSVSTPTPFLLVGP